MDVKNLNLKIGGKNLDKKIVGVFKSEQSAIKAIERLKANGYLDSEISVLAKHSEKLGRISDATGAEAVDDGVADGAVGGAVAGGVLGGIGALLVELGVLAIPGVGPFLAAGPIAATLAGIVAGGAVGGIVGVLVDLGFNEEDAEEYETYLNRGDILVLVDDKGDKGLVYDNFYENESVIRDRYDAQRDTRPIL